MKKTNGSIIQVSLQKEQVATGEDEGKVKSFILKGLKNTIGYIICRLFMRMGHGEQWTQRLCQ